MHDAALPTTDGTVATDPRVRDQLRSQLENDLRAEAMRDRCAGHGVATFGDGPGSVAMFGDGPGLVSDAAFRGDG
jgi:hypothetical protein